VGRLSRIREQLGKRKGLTFPRALRRVSPIQRKTRYLQYIRPHQTTIKFSSSDTPAISIILCLPLPDLLCSLSLRSTSATMSPPPRPLHRTPACPSLRPPHLPICSISQSTASCHPNPSTPTLTAPQSLRDISLVTPNASTPSTSSLSSWKTVKFRMTVSLSFRLHLSLPRVLRRSRSKSETSKRPTTSEKLRRRPTPPPAYQTSSLCRDSSQTRVETSTSSTTPFTMSTARFASRTPRPTTTPPLNGTPTMKRRKTTTATTRTGAPLHPPVPLREILRIPRRNGYAENTQV
jgi:hypothetical protein